MLGSQPLPYPAAFWKGERPRTGIGGQRGVAQTSGGNAGGEERPLAPLPLPGKCKAGKCTQRRGGESLGRGVLILLVCVSCVHQSKRAAAPSLFWPKARRRSSGSPRLRAAELLCGLPGSASVWPRLPPPLPGAGCEMLIMLKEWEIVFRGRKSVMGQS